MKVFISWSGDLSKELGEALRDWLPSVIQSIKPFFTPNDIEKGSRWGKDIAQELEESSIGIFCLTRENLTKPWIMFEAGALSKELDVSKVCPILFGIDNTDLEGPLVQFQSSPFKKNEIKQLLMTINKCLEENQLEDEVFNNVFDMWWPKLEDKVKSILSKDKPTTDVSAIRNDREILEEILELSRLNLTSKKKINSNNSHISPGAFHHLLGLLEQCIANIKNDESSKEILSRLSNLTTPIDHIIRNSNLEESDKNRFLEELQDLDFK